MAFFINPASKFERALRALLFLQGKTTWDDAFVSNESRKKKRPLPNRSFIVRSFNPTRGWRPEGVCVAEIQHHFHGIDQPNQPDNAQQVAMAAYVGDTLDTLNLGGSLNATDMAPLADSITLAGRWLAAPDPNGQPGDDADLIVKSNLDMANFRCDWVKLSTPMMTRGTDTDTTNWVEIVHLSAFVSHSSEPVVNLPPPPLEVQDSALVPTVSDTGVIYTWPFLDAKTGTVRYLRVKDGILYTDSQ